MAQVAHTFRMEKSVLNKLKEIAAKEKRSLNNLVEVILEDYAKRKK
ncbi:MAG: hypothetical protein R3361_04590 [Aequorivita vladivostokensis]|nr:hypothetical protein [Aequorivita vladivostokensis]